jgi:hypothetical protein
MSVSGDCGIDSNELTLKNSNAAVLTKNKNIGSSVSLLTKFQMENYFEYSVSDTVCLINSFTVVEQDSDDEITSGTLYDLLNLDDRESAIDTITADTRISRTDGSDHEFSYQFRIRATTAGGFILYKEIEFNIKICGNENISRLTSQDNWVSG